MKKLQIIALFILTIGWFPFMWIAIWGSWHREFAVWVLCLGIILCISSALILAQVLTQKALWLNQEELDKEVQNFRDAKAKYEKATLEIVKVQQINKISYQKKCFNCKDKFTSKRCDAQFCSDTCRSSNTRKLKKKL
jgi:hypothetical protein